MTEEEEQEHCNLLGMMGAILSHVGRVEIPIEEITSTDFSTKEFSHYFDQDKQVAVFELNDIVEQVPDGLV